MLYCNARIGFSVSILSDIFFIVSVGKALGAGFPAANEIISGNAQNFKISLIADA